MMNDHSTDDELAPKSSSSSSKTSSTADASPVPIPLVLELALIRTLATLQQLALADAEACTVLSAKVRERWELGEGADPIDVLIRLRAQEGAMMDSMMEMASLKMARSLPVVPARVPFVSKLIPPNGFYEKLPEIAKLSRLLLAPISFAEDFDVIGIASVNPYFAEALAGAIQEEFEDKSINPIVTIVRLDRISWMKMCEKHFR